MNTHDLLKHYHDKYLVPSENEKAQIQSRVQKIINAFQHSSYFSPMEHCIAGSFKKGTMLAGRGEADIEFFYPNRSIYFHDLQREAVRIIQDNFPEADIVLSDMAVNVLFPYGENDIAVDIVVGHPVNSPLQMSQVSSKKQHLVTTGRIHVEYTKIQKGKFPYYQSTVRLIKDWRDAQDIPLKSLHIDLMVASLFDTWTIVPMEYPDILRAFFRHLVSMCDGVEILPANWDKFQEEDITARYTLDGIMIIDPADPSDNLADSLDSDDIADIKSEATRAIHLIDTDQWVELFDEDMLDRWT